MKKSGKMLYRLWLGVFMGLITGVLGRIINFLIDNMFGQTKVFFSEHTMLIMPIIGGVLLGLYRKYSNPNNPSGFDVAVVREELRCIQSYLMKPIYVFVNMIALGISLISGWSVGKQGPVVYLGAAIGSFFAYGKKRDDEEIKILIAGGVAGILATVFQSPLFAIAFVIEVILHNKAVKDWTPIIISALTATLVDVGMLGHVNSSYWQVYINILKQMDIKVVFEPLVCVYMAIIIGIVAAGYTKGIHFMKRLCIEVNKPVMIAFISGIFISAVGYVYPQIFNAHTRIIPSIVSDYTGLYFLIGLAIAKFIVTVISLSAGGVGGVFVPGLYIGATIGKAFGIAMSMNNLTSMPNGVYAIIGMVAFFGGFSSAPLSAAFLVVEITKEPRFMIPVLFVSLLSGAVYRLFCEQSVYGNSLLAQSVYSESTKL